MKIVSVIIPVYNAEKYLAKCLDSILSQTYPALEIIIVNDGSKDGSISICHSYCKKFSNIKLIDKGNTGQADSRYIGFKESTGDYIYCVDSDDYIEPNAIQTLVAGLESTRADMFFCRSRLVDAKGKEISQTKKYKTALLEGRNKIINDALSAENIKASLCIKLCDRNLWEKAYTSEVRDIHFNEDYFLTVLFSIQSCRVAFSNEIIYNALQRSKSISRKPRPDVIASHDKYFPVIRKILTEQKDWETTKESFFRGYTKNIYYSLFIVVVGSKNYQYFINFYKMVGSNSIFFSRELKNYIKSGKLVDKLAYLLVRSPILFYFVAKFLSLLKQH